jgi:hypothetical protein
MSVLDTFFEGPGFDPTFQTRRNNESGGGAHSLPPRFTIPVIVTSGEEGREWVTEVNSPGAGGTPAMTMALPDARRTLACSLDSPTAQLPLWIQADASFSSDT